MMTLDWIKSLDPKRVRTLDDGLQHSVLTIVLSLAGEGY